MGGFLGGGGSATSSGPSISAASSLQVQTSQAGVVIRKIYGTTRVAGNLIDYTDFRAVAQQSSSQSGGGGKGIGGGGGGGGQTTGYEYYATVLFGLAAGPIGAVLKVWDGSTVKGGPGAIGGSVFLGASGQQPWSYMTGAHPERALGYNSLGYVACANMDIGQSASLPNYTFEVCGSLALTPGGDANPADVIADMLTDINSGAALPAAMVGDFSLYRSWCTNLGMGISPGLDSQTAVRDTIVAFLDATQAQAFWSRGMIHIVPYGDMVPSAFNGSLAPVLTFSDFFPEDGDLPVAVTRADPSDLYNRYVIEYYDRANNYNTATITSDDGAHIDTYGLRAEGTQSWHWITNGVTAHLVADLRRNRYLGVAATYVFQVGEIASLLEPLDVIALTEPTIGLDNYPVRVTQIEEVSDGIFKVTAEDIPGAMADITSRPTPTITGYAANYGISPGSINAPVLFEPPLTLAGDLELWAALSSSNAHWGGAHVWLSLDGDSYRRIGTVTASARQGTLSAPLALGTAQDGVNTLSVDLRESNGQLSSVSATDAAANVALAYVDGEFLAYQTATLTGVGQYNLTTLTRGLYGSTISAHPAGSAFARLDQTIFKYPFSADQIGKSIYIKFTSFNVFGAAEEDISAVPSYYWHVTGNALAYRLPDLTGVSTAYVAGIMQIVWDAPVDARALDVEVRMGAAWTSAQIIGRTSQTSMATRGDGTYWIAAHYTVGSGSDAIDIYSPDPIEVVVSGAQLVSNVIASHDEAASGWTGTLSGLIEQQGDLYLCGAGDIAAAADIAAIADIASYGGMVGSGTYQMPADHQIRIGRVAACQVLMSVAVRGQSIHDDISTVPDVALMTDVSGSNLGPSVYAVPQLRLSQDDGATWGAWQNWIAGSYSATSYDFRVLVGSTVTDVTAILGGFTAAVDVPDRSDSYDLISAAAPVSVTFTALFNGGPSGLAAPVVSVAIVAGGQPGDTVQVSAISLTGCVVTVYSAAGAIVAGRSIHLIVEGY